MFDGKDLGSIDWGLVVIAGTAGFLAGLIPGTGVASLIAQATVSSIVENGLKSLGYGEDFDLLNVIRDASLSILTGIALKGMTHFLSKATSKMFIKGKNYSQFQCYFRRQGFNFSRLEVYSMIEKYTFYKEASDEIIKTTLDFFVSFAIYPY